MRWLVVLVLVPVLGCSGSGAVAPDASDPGGSCGGLPPPACGQGTCACCVGCSRRDQLCFGDPGFFELGTGSCVAPGTQGTLQVTIAANAFAATQSGATISGADLEIVARNADQTVAMLAPATPGTYSCADASVVLSFAYYSASQEAHNRPTSPRPACTVTVQSVGNVGDQVTGTFSATLSDGAGNPIDLANGMFSVPRLPYP
jgi:hypothetical protein